MIKAGLKNEDLINELLISGSLAVKPKSSTGVNYFEEVDTTDGVLAAKLTKPHYNKVELLKSIDTTITELLPLQKVVIPPTVPLETYQTASLTITDLTVQITGLNTTITDLNSKLTTLQSTTQSLQSITDSEKLNVASFQNQATQANLKVQSSIVDLQNALQKAASEAVQRISLTAINQSLTSQIASLTKQIDTLNQQLSAQAQAVNAGGVPTGQLSTILFDGGGDPTRTVFPSMIYQDYNGGNASVGTFAAPNNEYKSSFRSNFTIIANTTTDIIVSVTFTGNFNQPPFDFGITLPVTIAAGTQLKFPLNKPNTYLNGFAGGSRGPGLIGLIQKIIYPSKYDFTMTVSISDATTKTINETKDFTFHIYKY